ncbi:cytochrome P450 [Streptomyces sp. NPDC002018]|uniref:cytochrome P450 n=1 Tax=Streptomyces sp. NPDC002018 TaxID=3364629 RepID=UPI003684629A
MYDLLTPEFREDPYPTLRQMRRSDPVHFSPQLNAWLVTRYEDVVTGLAHPAISADRITPRINQFPEDSRAQFESLATMLRAWPLMADPPRHASVRKPVTSALHQRIIRSFRPLVTRTVQEILSGALSDGTLDAVDQLAVPVPLLVVSEIIGIPRDGLDLLKRCAVDIVSFFGTPPATYLPTAAEALRSISQANDFLKEIIEQRRRSPRNDMISTLLADPSATTEKVAATCMMMVFAGFETTTNLLGNGLLLLMRHPDQRNALREQPDLIPAAVEEMLRIESPVQRLSRMAAMDLELNGKHIRAGDLVFFLTGAANHDPDVFPDPEKFDIHRKPTSHLAFGDWIHACPGANLARLEAEIVFSELLKRTSSFTLQKEETWHDNLSVRALKELPLKFS